jgi:hypothetical protein
MTIRAYELGNEITTTVLYALLVKQTDVLLTALRGVQHVMRRDWLVIQGASMMNWKLHATNDRVSS